MNNQKSLLTVKQLFENKRYFIPDYQRGYSWEDEQRKDLLEDIESTLDSDYMHYTGTIVAAHNKNDQNVYEIVDGQQRLTSLFILLHELYKMNATGLDEEINSWLQSIFEKSDSERILKLNNETDDFFCKVILDRSNDESLIENKSHRNIYDTKIQFDNWMEKNKKNIKKIIEAIITRLGFLFYSPLTSKEIGIMFEVINNRGKMLSELEKIKNYLIYYSCKTGYNKLSDTVKRYWPDILKDLSKADKTTNDEEDAFLRYTWLVFYSSNKQESYHVYETMKINFPVESSNESRNVQLNNFVLTLSESAKYYSEYFKEEDSLLEKLRYHPVNASIMPLYLSICLVLDDQDKEGKNKLLEILEKLNFRIYVAPDVTKRADTNQGTLFEFANKFYNFNKGINHDNEKFEKKDLYNNLVGFIKENCKINKSFVQSLTLDRDEDYDYHNWQGLLYFLANYEIYLNQKKTIRLSEILKDRPNGQLKPDDRLTREHIWARENRRTNGKNNREQDDHEKKRLGNFVLLEGGINSQGDKNDLDKKLDIYLKKITQNQRISYFLMVHKLEDIYKEALQYSDSESKVRSTNWYYRLYRKINDIREKDLIYFAIKRWGLDDEQKYSILVDSDKAEKEGSHEVFFITES